MLIALMMLGFIVTCATPIYFGIGMFTPKTALPFSKEPTKGKVSLVSLLLLTGGFVSWISFAPGALQEIKTLEQNHNSEVLTPYNN